LSALAARPSIDCPLLFQVGHDAMLFKVVDVQCLEELFEVLLPLLQLLEEFLGM